jgi:predicted AAA+ superfamily ATPase
MGLFYNYVYAKSERVEKSTLELKRFSEETIKNWYFRQERKPLVVRGARQVGKSTLIRNFAKKHSIKLYEINFERHTQFADLFEKLEIDEIITELEVFTKLGKINPRESIIFLDEIQAAPLAIKALRYFFEDYPELPVIAAGSLLEFTLSDHHFSMPVGRIEYLFLGPMTFEEYLEAKGEDTNLAFLRNFDFKSRFPESAHKHLIKLLREFFLVGGMPEAVKQFLSTDNFEHVIQVHSSIVETYRDDFAKYARGNDLLRLQKVFDYVPYAIGEKIKYSSIDKNMQARDLKKAIDLLSKARVVSPVYHSKSSGIPIRAGKNNKIFKMYFLDVGLMNRICGIDHIPLSRIENGVDFINKGKIAEQFVQQHLLYLGRPHETPQLFYWLREGRSSNAEVDFVIQRGEEIIPIEIKAGKSGSLKSLHRFILEKKGSQAIRFDLNPPSRMKIEHKINDMNQRKNIKFNLLSLPLYLIEQFPRLLIQ